MILLQLLIGLIGGIIAAAIASSKGRSVVGWFFCGFFIGLIGIIIVAVLPNLKVQRAQMEQAARQRRRLREQLRQERHRGETYRHHSTQRLDAHDEALGMDTRSPEALPGAELALHQLRGESTPQGPPANPARAVWYYEINGQTLGPVSQLDIKELLLGRKIGRATLLWTEELGDWTALAQVPAFGSMVDR